MIRCASKRTTYSSLVRSFWTALDPSAQAIVISFLQRLLLRPSVQSRLLDQTHGIYNLLNSYSALSWRTSLHTSLLGAFKGMHACSLVCVASQELFCHILNGSLTYFFHSLAGMQSHEGPLGNVGTAPCASLAISYVLSTEHTIPNDSACATTNSKASFRPSGRVFPYIVTHVRLLCRCTVDAIKYLLLLCMYL